MSSGFDSSERTTQTELGPNALVPSPGTYGLALQFEADRVPWNATCTILEPVSTVKNDSQARRIAEVLETI